MSKEANSTAAANVKKKKIVLKICAFINLDTLFWAEKGKALAQNMLDVRWLVFD
jgi:hypothetical protein